MNSIVFCYISQSVIKQKSATVNLCSRVVV